MENEIGQVRAKFRVQSITRTHWGSVEFNLAPQYDDKIPEDRRFAKATPDGNLRMVIDNPPAAEFFELGKLYYLDFTPVPATVGAGG